MFDNNKILAFIPARGGSKGLKDKNIHPIGGKPLVGHTIEAALASKYIDDVVVSTDSEKIADVAKKFGAEVPFLRPAEIAGDTSKTIDAIVYTLQKLKESGKVYDDFILLQPTSPLRTTDILDAAIEKYFKFDRKSLVSVSKVKDLPVLVRTVVGEDKMEKLLNQNSTVRRQDAADYYKVNGAIYINKIADINQQTSFNDNEVPFIMAAENSIDIDDYSDVEIAKYWYNRMKLTTQVKSEAEISHIKTIEQLLEIIRSYREILIYPLGNEGNRFLDYLKYKNLIGKISCIAVESAGIFNNIPQFQNGLPKMPLELLTHMKDSAVFLVPVPKVWVQRVENILQKFGCKKVVFVDEELHQQIQKELKIFGGVWSEKNLRFVRRKAGWADADL